MLRRGSLLLILTMLLSLFPVATPSSSAAASDMPPPLLAFEPSRGLSLDLLPETEQFVAGEMATATLVLYPEVDIEEFLVTLSADGAAGLKGNRSFTLPGATAGAEVRAAVQ